MKRFLFRNSLLLFVILLAMACNQKVKNNKTPETDKIVGDTVQVKYAKGFTIRQFNGYKLVDVQDPQGKGGDAYHYAFVDRGKTPRTIPDGYQRVEVPIRSSICMTMLQLSNFIKLDALDNVVGITSTHYIFDKNVKSRLKNGQIKKIGIEGNFDQELIMALNPDVIFVSPFKRGGYESIKELNMPLIVFLCYNETSALGQAEWLKFTGILLGKEQEARAIFNKIEQRYNSLIDSCKMTTKNRPTVLSGEMRSGNWYVVGGKSSLAEQLKDAGADYFLADNDDTGGLNLDFESVYSKAANADYWRLLVSYTGQFSYDLFKKKDDRYTYFKAFKDRKIIYCNLREKPYWEKSPIEPEVILADFIKIFHPELLPNHKPVYYELLDQ